MGSFAQSIGEASVCEPHMQRKPAPTVVLSGAAGNVGLRVACRQKSMSISS